MTKRSSGVTVLAFSTIMVALYSQYAALALLLTGSVFLPSGEIAAMITLVTGATFVGLTAAGYIIGAGLWLRRSWSWGWAVALYLTFFVANAFLSALASNFGSSVLPTIGVAAVLVFLNRPAVRAELRPARTASTVTAPAAVGERREFPEPAR